MLMSHLYSPWLLWHFVKQLQNWTANMHRFCVRWDKAQWSLNSTSSAFHRARGSAAAAPSRAHMVWAVFAVPSSTMPALSRVWLKAAPALQGCGTCAVILGIHLWGRLDLVTSLLYQQSAAELQKEFSLSSLGFRPMGRMGCACELWLEKQCPLPPRQGKMLFIGSP